MQQVPYFLEPIGQIDEQKNLGFQPGAKHQQQNAEQHHQSDEQGSQEGNAAYFPEHPALFDIISTVEAFDNSIDSFGSSP
ncbi:hypothetical protein D3C75_1216070 [compost metagenome]